jgi:biopolymer transport protein ExbD
MAGTMAAGGRVKTISAINVTPLVDVMLVLLVVLMVTDGTAEKPTTVQILKTGEFRLNEQPIDDRGLEEKLKTAAAADAEMSLVVSADKEAQHGMVVHVMDIAKVAGITKFAINVMQVGSE